jgi:hypothetical protein
MRKVVFALLAVSALAAVSTTSAEAWGGCGPYRHPTPWGCRFNGGYGPGYGFYGPRPYWGGWHRRYYGGWRRHW